MMRAQLVLALVAGAGCRQIFGIDEDVPFVDAAPQCMFRDVGTGRNHMCAIDKAGQVWCWGRSWHGSVQPGAPDQIFDPIVVGVPGPSLQIAVGRDFSCARTETGEVWCWGDNSTGQLGTGTKDLQSTIVQIPLGGSHAIDLAAGGHHACIRRDGDQSVVCWGDNQFMQAGQDVATVGKLVPPTQVPNTAGAQKLAIGHNHNCIVDAAGRTRCWGRNERGQLGDLGPDRAQPAQVTGIGTVVALAAGGKHSCAVEDTGALRCWGDGGDGQLGLGSFAADPALPPGQAAIDDAIGVAATSFGTCAQRESGGVSCWGNIDPGTSTAPEQSTLPLTSSVMDAVQVSAKFWNVCARTATGVLCWGDNAAGQLGRGTHSGSPTAVPVSLPAPATVLDSSFFRACAVVGSALSCWGSGPIGDGTRTTALAPKIIATLPSVSGVAVDRSFACAWNNEVRCWGANDHGQLGNGTTIESLVPVAVLDGATHLMNVSKVAISSGHACAIVGTGLKCWGRNNAGQLGNNMTQDSLVPVTVALTNVTDVSTGGAWYATSTGNSCAIANGFVNCWGDNTYGQIGNNSTTAQHVPTMVSTTVTGWVQVSTGGDHSCARTQTGDVYCWGHNNYGQLGLGNTTDRHVPTKLTLPAPARWIGVHGRCAILVNDDVYCWTNDDQLGVLLGSLPLPLAPLKGASSVSFTGTGGCALIGTAVSCWGTESLLGSGDLSGATPAPPNVSCTGP